MIVGSHEMRKKGSRSSWELLNILGVYISGVSQRMDRFWRYL